jgi:ferrochelatase
LTDPAVIFDAVIVVSFGGPERPEDVMPFLENVTRGRDVPRERLLEVAKNYELFGGVSPINEQNRRLVADLQTLLRQQDPNLPVYFGNRNWAPYLADTIRQMADDGVERALAFVTSAYSSYSGCRQYLENIEQARAAVGTRAPVIEKLRAFWNHPGFIVPMAEAVDAALAAIPAERRTDARLVYTAHSLPLGLARTSDYELQLRDACGLVALRLSQEISWDLVYQSRSGPPSQPWLEPDILDHLTALAEHGVGDVVNLPIGFISDHMEVVYDLDTQAQRRATELRIEFTRVPTVGTHPLFIQMIRELIVERIDPLSAARALGNLGPRPMPCAPGCCPPPQRHRPAG